MFPGNVFFLFLTSLVLISPASAQENLGRHDGQDSVHLTRDISIAGSIGRQGSLFADLGVSLKKSGSVGHHPTFSVYYLATEIIAKDRPIFGPKVGLFFGGGAAAMGLGISAVYYTDLQAHSLRLKPEIGLGMHNFKIAYGYTFDINGADAFSVPRHSISVTLLFRLKKLSTPAVQHGD